MNLTKSFLLAAIGLSVFILPAYSSEQKTAASTSTSSSDLWVPVQEDDWAIYMDAPAYHFALAKEYLKKGDNANAIAELKRGNSFVIFEQGRLAAASKQIENLSKNLAKGKDKDTAALDAVTSKVENVIDRKYAMLPIDIGANTVFEDAYRYHFDKAKSKLQEGDRAGAAFEIKRGAAFLRLKASLTKHVVKADLDEAGNDLKTLATKVESGAIKDVKELDHSFQKAIGVIEKKKS